MQGAPTVPEIFLYAAGAVMSFTLLEGVLSHGFRRSMPEHHTVTLALGTSMNIASVLLALALALLVNTAMTNTFVWVVAPFVATVAYLLLESIETAIAEKVQLGRGDPTADEVSG